MKILNEACVDLIDNVSSDQRFILGSLTLQQYNRVKDSGLLWVKYPEATGSPNEDLFAVCFASKNGKHYYDILDEEIEYDDVLKYLENLQS